MSNVLTIVLNGESQLEYQRDKPLPEAQRYYLDAMDQKMQQGIPSASEIITQPNLMQRVQFVAQSLFEAIIQQNEPTAAAMCAYLATRVPELRQVKGKAVEGELTVDLVFDESYVKPQPLHFVPPGTKKTDD